MRSRRTAGFRGFGYVALATLVACGGGTSEAPAPRVEQPAQTPPTGTGGAAKSLRFTDQSRAAGLDFVPLPMLDTPEPMMEGGGTVGDFNADGWPDLFVLGGGGVPDQLFVNNGDGTFSEQGADWGVAAYHRGIGATACDLDGDGWQDLYVTSLGADPDAPAQPGAHRLYHNNGDFTFTDVAADAGVQTTADSHADGYGAACGDYDLDGDLDLFVGGWHGGTSLGSRLFRNDGSGRFAAVNAQAGVLLDDTNGFGAIFADTDGDRWPELLVAGDFGTSRYYINNRDGTFTEADIFGERKVDNGMGAAAADFDGDGSLDWFITAIDRGPDPSGGNRLYLNRGGHRFDALPESAGVNHGGWGWGTAAADFDHDGRVDLVMTNGWDGTQFRSDPTRLFINNGDGTFSDAAAAAGIDHAGQGRGLVTLDYDRDGDVDIVIFGFAERPTLYRNDLEGDGVSWLGVVLDTTGDTALPPDGYGSRITVEADGRNQTVWVHGGASYLGRSELVAHFGLGTAQRAARVTVVWADGSRTELTDVAVNRYLDVTAPPR